MLKNRFKRLRIPLLGLIAVLAITSGGWIQTVKSDQITYYNQAMELYALGKTDQSSELLTRSIESYETQVNAGWLNHMILGRPSSEVAALAHFHQGVLLLAKSIQEQRPGIMGQAVDEFEMSLKINPGAPYSKDISPAEAQRLNEQALVVKHDLDLLFQQHPEQQNRRGGNKPGNQPGEQVPGNQPGSQPGSGQSDGL